MIYIVLILLIIGFALFKAYKNTHDIKINHIQVSSKTSSKQAENISILQLSDLHLENISLKPEQLAKKLENKTIDLIALTGDFLDRKRTIPKLIPYLQVLGEINPTYGIYAVLGNHDYILKNNDLQQLKSVLQQYNTHVLQNESKTIDVNGKKVNIIGIDDFSTKRSNVSKAYRHIRKGKNIVLTHDPNIVLKMDEYQFDYLMAGHFHGGQILYPKPYHLVKMGELARKKIIKGLHTINGSPFYISEGLGQTGVNIRIGSRPEITFHQFSI